MIRAVVDPFADGVNHRFGAIQNKWLNAKLSRLSGLRGLFVKRRHWQKKTGYSMAEANRELRQSVDRLRVGGILPLAGLVNVALSFDASAEEINDYCEEKSLECVRIGAMAADQWPGLRALVLLDAIGIDSKELLSKRDKKTGEIVERDWQARVGSAAWWRRRVRVICARGSEAVLQDTGYVSRYSGAYISNFGFKRWVESQRRGRALLESMEIVDTESGEVLPMVSAVDASVSNPEHRRGELMTRARGFEECAEAAGFVPMFYTVTCPSKYHVFSGRARNKNYNGATPREASAYLTGLWARCRSMLAKQGIEFFGFRVAEPHHDGCPHWHLLLFVNPLHKWALTEIIAGHALEEDGDEDGADKHRFTAVQIEADSSGSSGATGYIAKYISKNIDGFSVGDDFESGKPADLSALRVRAWASVWGIRQFQQIGGPSVTVWRELRRVANSPERIHVDDKLRKIIEAADAGDWSAFVLLMGGAVCSRVDRPAAIVYSDKDVKTGQPRKGCYGDAVVRVVGVISRVLDSLVITRWKIWEVRLVPRVGAVVEKKAVAFKSFTDPPQGVSLDLCQ
ncbi:MAG: replication endonuclease [Candidatus Reddybacter sp.]